MTRWASIKTWITAVLGMGSARPTLEQLAESEHQVSEQLRDSERKLQDTMARNLSTLGQVAARINEQASKFDKANPDDDDAGSG